MDPRLQKRLMLFYLGGVINAFLGAYVLVEGRSFLPERTATWLVVFFFAFAAVDFWFPYAIRRKWERDRVKETAGLEAERKP
jgi:uncharacterized membrane protein YfcA